MLDYGMFEATRTVSPPAAYLFRAEPPLLAVRDLLRRHGVAIEELTASADLEVESFVTDAVNHNPRPFQGHRETSLAGRWQRGTIAFPAGTCLVRTSQPLASLAAYLLEPESEDGVVNWNRLDTELAPGKVVPIAKLSKVVNLPARLVPRDPEP